MYFYRNTNPVFNSPELKHLALKHKTSISQVVISWVLQENCVVIPRASKQTHILENKLSIIMKNVSNHDIGYNSPSHIHVFLTREDIELIRSLDGTIGTPWD